MFGTSSAPPITFFHTLPMPCPYLSGRTERRLVADISTRRGRISHDTLARAGFRRTQHLCYRPACPSCTACVPIRIAVERFDWTRTFRRTLSRNADLSGARAEARSSREQFELFRLYQGGRHGDGEMALMDYADYADMIERSPIETAVVEYRDPAGVLRAAVLVDHQDDGLSAVYSFFEPGDPSRSLGTFMVLDLVRRARALSLPYVYLGYWIAESPKMSYKTRFQPCEVLLKNGWTALPPTTSIQS